MIPLSSEEKPVDCIPLTSLGGLPPRRPQLPPAPLPEPAPMAAVLQPYAPVSMPLTVQAAAIFSCPQCQATLTTQGANLPGACPTCGHWITAVPLAPLTLDSLPNALAPMPQDAPVPHSETAPELFPLTEAPVPGDPDLQDEVLFSRRPHAHRIHRSGQVDFRALSLEDIRERGPEFDQKNPGGDRPGFPDSPTGSPYQRRRIPTLVWVTAAWVAVLLVLATVIGMGRLSSAASLKQTKSSVPLPPLAGIQEKLNLSARETLTKILTSTDPEVIANHVIGGDAMLPAIRERLGADEAFPSLSEADLVSPIPMNEADLRRGFCGLLYEAAPGDPMTLKNPLLSLAMAKGVAGLGLLEAGAVIESESSRPPRQAMALFAKRNGRQLLEWELFIQTWDRTLIAFSEGKLGDGPMRFRVILSRDKPVFENGEFVDQTVIRVQDPFHQQDILRVVTYAQDPVIAALTPTGRELRDDPLEAMKPRTATVDLVRSKTGHVAFDKLVCKEFLGLGGHEGDSGADRGKVAGR